MKRFVTNSAKKILPDSLEDYLFELAEKTTDVDIQTFQLKPCESGGQPAQLIEHTVYRSGYTKMYLMGTYLTESTAPLDAIISIYCDETSYNMSLAGLNRTELDYTQEADMPNLQYCPAGSV
ncbi:hypothetical protein LJC56_00460 [Christensenellaceae bacterium OttesenSCG-928-K19]|nr:hypothetical protein [Christensenellaceae bacterium OttesenSCG-928-K19]